MQAATIPICGLAQCKTTVQKGEVSLRDLPVSFSFKDSMKVRTSFVSPNYQPRLLGTMSSAVTFSLIRTEKE